MIMMGASLLSQPKVHHLIYMDDLELLNTFVSSYLSGHSALLSNSDLRIEPISDTLQLLAKTEGLVATAKLAGEQRFTSIRYKSSFWPQLHEAMVEQRCLPIRQSRIAGFYEYEPVDIPDHYRVRFTDSLDLLQTWWSYKKSDKKLALMSLLILHRGIWYPIRDVNCEHGSLCIETSGYQAQIYPLDMLVWLQKVEQPALPPSSSPVKTKNKTNPSHFLSDHSEQYLSAHRRAIASEYPDNKRIGGYLIEAGLLSPAQVDVVLSDQELTGMRFGEILVSRGWLKSQTIEFLFQNVILPHRTLAKQRIEAAKQESQESVDYLKGTHATHTAVPAASKVQDSQAIQPIKQPVAEPIKEIELAPRIQTPQQLPTPSASLSVPVDSPQSSPSLSKSPRPLSIHDRETLATHNKLNLEDLPDWLEMDGPE